MTSPGIPPHITALYLAIPGSREQATSVKALMQQFDLTDREVREQIKEAREEHGIPIICLPVRNGVWITSDPGELDALIACQTSRARSLERSARVLMTVRDGLVRPTLFSEITS